MTTNQTLTVITALQSYRDSGRITKEEYLQIVFAFWKLVGQLPFEE